MEENELVQAPDTDDGAEVSTEAGAEVSSDGFDELAISGEAEREAEAALAEELTGMPKEERARFAAARRKNELVQAVEKARKEERAKAEREYSERERIKELATEQMREISRLDPTVSTLGDVTKLETGKKFREYVGKGLNFVEAFKLANMERLQKTADNVSKHQAFKLISSKGHLQPTVTRGQGALRVPPEEMEMYRQLNPGMSESEIMRHYNLYKREK